MADAPATLTLSLDSGGDVVIKLRPDVAPGHVERITTLAAQGFYDGIPFHRVIPGFMDSLRRCHGSYSSTSLGSGGLGPTTLISPMRTFKNFPTSLSRYFESGCASR